jgi:hypothetical protein
MSKTTNYKHYISFNALWFYIPVLLTGIFLGQFILALIPPVHKSIALTGLYLSLLNAELAYYRFGIWRPWTTKAFKLGIRETISLVHTEGVLRYKKDGTEYSLYSNIYVPPTKEPVEKHAK